ncbi:RRP12-like protein [Amphiprion ocellaris]|uniref:Ribosomal RNA-processing protein 12-like conserved domain-containing protein n=1 Tax=Amphiprion ocellaris TaxID=80972 RepID=A0A3Q1BGG3_AMPOC|nr:RRP12-like protein [Amphiprion ocellaris]
MVKSGKLRSGTGSKLKRWKKGHSSDSNPQSSRFRQAAKSRFFSRPSGKSDLTVDALKLHNELQVGPLEVGAGGRKDACMEEDPDEMLSERTSGTFLSGLSDCSNLTFRKVQRFWESNSAAHKEICAVLAAVTEVIRGQGGKETETEYFAALMTTLEVVDTPESQAAVSYLLNLVMKRVPAPVLMSKFSDTTKALMDIMSKQATSDTASALRWILSCLATLLRKQDVSVWTYPSTLQAYHGLLSFTVHSKPKVRKAAQQGVCSILRGSDFLFKDNAPTHHPAAVTTAKFCIKEMEQAGGSKEDTTTLHVLGLLKDLMGTFPLGAVKSCCETLLRVMTLSHVLVTASAMQAFHRLFSGKANASTLSSELNAQIITALYDYLPSENDLQPLLAWLAVMEKAHVHLASLQSSLSLGHLPRLFSAAMSCLLSPHTQVVSAATNTLKTLLTECVAPHMEEMETITATASSGNPSYICRMFRIIEEGLSYRFHASWPFVLQVLGCFYRAAGKQAHPIMTKSLQSLADLRSTPQFPFSGELDLAVGGAVESMGPEVVLGAVPLNITGYDDDLEFPRSWLIPVIRDHVKNTQLGFFVSYFLPLASTLKQRAEELEQAGQKLEAKVYQTLQLQIWTMLPGFCTCPVDLIKSFKGMARTLGMAINERPDLRLTVCQALRTIINKSCSTEEEKAEMGRFSKNFLPILFNVYSQQPAAGESGTYRMAVLDTIKVYLTVTEMQMVCTFLQKATERLTSTQSTEFTRLSVMDLVVAMAPCVDEASMTQTFELIRPYLETKEPGMQKKAYRVLEEMCGAEREECKSFVVSNLETLKVVLLETLKNASSPAKRPRLKCLIHIVKRLNEEHKDFITALLPEVIICTKEVSVGARKNAYTLLVEIGNAFIRFCGNTKEAMEQYLVLLYAGLTGSVTMITCTVLALTRLVFEYKDSIEVTTMEQLLHNVCLLLSSRTREIVKAALGFIKVILFIMDPKTLASHVAVMMEGIGNIKDDVRRHFRTKLKNIFTKFIRKFGFELVKSMLPAEHHKVLANIRKAEARSKRRKQAAEEQDDSDSEEEAPKTKSESIEDILAESDSDLSEDEGKARNGQKKAGKQQKGRAWLREGGEDDPLNFLDPKVSQRVLATNPELKKSAKVDHGFKVTSDGRLIIRDDEEEDVKDKDSGEMKDILEEAGVKSKKSQKRKFQDDNFDDDMDIEPQFSYKAGGSGIHRPLGGCQDIGGDYQSKKGKGDVKKKGKLDPYAYIPLKKAQLNRRKRAKLQGQFKGMVRGAQKGALSGKKMQKKKRKA